MPVYEKTVPNFESPVVAALGVLDGPQQWPFQFGSVISSRQKDGEQVLVRPTLLSFYPVLTSSSQPSAERTHEPPDTTFSVGAPAGRSNCTDGSRSGQLPDVESVVFCAAARNQTEPPMGTGEAVQATAQMTQIWDTFATSKRPSWWRRRRWPGDWDGKHRGLVVPVSDSSLPRARPRSPFSPQITTRLGIDVPHRALDADIHPVNGLAQIHEKSYGLL